MSLLVKLLRAIADVLDEHFIDHPEPLFPDVVSASLTWPPSGTGQPLPPDTRIISVEIGNPTDQPNTWQA